MTLMLAAASICTTDALERQLAPPGFECCERDLLGRSKPRDLAMRDFRRFSGSGINSAHGKNAVSDALGYGNDVTEGRSRSKDLNALNESF